MATGVNQTTGNIHRTSTNVRYRRGSNLTHNKQRTMIAEPILQVYTMKEESQMILEFCRPYESVLKITLPTLLPMASCNRKG